MNIDKGIGCIHFAGKHAAEFQGSQSFLDPANILFYRGEGIDIALFVRQFQQISCIANPGSDNVDTLYFLLQARPFATQFLGTRGVVPDIRLLQLTLDFGQAFTFGVVVKDTP